MSSSLIVKQQHSQCQFILKQMIQESRARGPQNPIQGYGYKSRRYKMDNKSELEGRKSMAYTVFPQK